MTLDHLAHTISSQFGEESDQLRDYNSSRHQAYDSYFGYRVIETLRNITQHREKPPIEQKIERHLYLCTKCGQEHESSRDLSITLDPTWLKTSKKTPARFKRELDELKGVPIELRDVVEQSMQGFDDIVFSILLSSAKGSNYCTRLVRIFGETSPNFPVLVNYWINENGKPRGSIDSFSDISWIIERASGSIKEVSDNS